ncbi:MAG: endolytic transglycosylase MltG [Bacteroidetes bacterium]|nr:MAG: aminodeoxychorismate lyase [Bacteroidetes bacterium OLB10]MBV6454321.1 Endolytic murein transglycosylase [Bacteroidia bacterium]MBX3106029.1 endolytic transglycosylase MltG [Bacteroidota bacterium]MCB8929848.1 endolytic transglycosylase MltG [Bacteroidia bacterium]MCO5288979.1 endolytic transglycosylase MltG [Bacteroidota bacterium]
MKKILLTIFFILILAGAGVVYYLYRQILAPNVSVTKENEFVYLPTGSTFSQVVDSLQASGMLQNVASFQWVAERMGYPEKVKPGKYQLRDGMNNRELVQLLRSGKQVPVKLIFNNIRTKSDLAGKISRQLEVDSLQLLQLLNDSAVLSPLGFNTENILCMFIPNTYEVYWNMSAEKFFKKMDTEYESFWNKTRLHKAKDEGLTPIQVSVLASIVQSETSRNSEKSTIAGVYMNRLRKNWKLEADPTLIYAMNDFSIKRVLNEYKEIDSPYNTYKYFGLPPGPICLPEISSLEAVLNFSSHDYMYFCAREDLSGYHSFASDLKTHMLNARRYQAELNRRNIRR